MGHSIPPELYASVVDEVRANADRAVARKRQEPADGFRDHPRA
jgi:hypothetical protein